VPRAGVIVVEARVQLARLDHARVAARPSYVDRPLDHLDLSSAGPARPALQPQPSVVRWLGGSELHDMLIERMRPISTY
jgi:hypothetical protein